VDLIHNLMLVDVRLRPGQGVVAPPVPKAPRPSVDGAAPPAPATAAGPGTAPTLGA
jgi:hypothetical protein